MRPYGLDGLDAPAHLPSQTLAHKVKFEEDTSNNVGSLSDAKKGADTDNRRRP